MNKQFKAMKENCIVSKTITLRCDGIDNDGIMCHNTITGHVNRTLVIAEAIENRWKIVSGVLMCRECIYRKEYNEQQEQIS